MQSFIVVAVLACVCGLASSDPEFHNSSLLDSLKGAAESARKEIAIRITNFTEAVEDKWGTVHDIMDGDFENETVNEFLGVDANGCDRKQRKHFEDRCDEQYEKVNDQAQEIEDEREKTEAVCCALEDFEKCSLRAYDQANCVTDKAAIRENLKAARLFLTVIANITCSEFRGQCAYYASSATGYASYFSVFAFAFMQLSIFSAGTIASN